MSIREFRMDVIILVLQRHSSQGRGAFRQVADRVGKSLHLIVALRNGPGGPMPLPSQPSSEAPR